MQGFSTGCAALAQARWRASFRARAGSAVAAEAGCSALPVGASGIAVECVPCGRVCDGSAVAAEAGCSALPVGAGGQKEAVLRRVVLPKYR